jgi:hypothetical protein
MKPWFEREAKIIKFPEPEKKVIQMPNVASYPDFITGVTDLKARVSKGEISQDSHDKLYTDLIHRFMRKEDVESPWFLREAIGALVGQELFKPNKTDKGLPRHNKFLQKIIQGEPFTAKNSYKDKAEDPYEVIIDPKEKKKVSTWIQANDPNAQLVLQTNKGNLTIRKTTMSPFDLVKGTEFGGQQIGMSGSAGAGGGKESKLVKISDLGLTDRDIPAKDLGNLIINNKILNQSTTGKVIIDMAKNILSGSSATTNPLDKNQATALRDYAGEYLGILMIVKGLATFPNQQPFYKHLKISNLDELVVNFPSKSNNRLADGFGKFAGLKNVREGFTINISVKGGANGKGAAPALSNFKVPDEFRKRKEFAEEIEFIDANANSANNQFTFPFVLLNIIHKYDPDKIPSYIKKFLPFTKIPNISLKEIDKFSKDATILKIFKAVRPEFLDKKGLSNAGKPPASKFHVVHYAIEMAVETALNNGALPDLSPLFREMLQQNFVQVSNTFKNNALQTTVLWPNTDLASGDVVYDSKNSMRLISSKACVRIQ